MGGEEAPTVPPEQRPDLIAIGLGQVKPSDLIAFDELKAPFAMGRGQGSEAWLDLEEKHQPMRVPRVAVFTDEPCEM